MSHYDVIIIGSGAGGATLAYHLATHSEKKILLLERGSLPIEERWYDKEEASFLPNTTYAVGGNTRAYGAALFRFREKDFTEVEHEGGLSPAWPISYQDLAPYYTKAEELYYVHGKRGEDPTAPPEQTEYAYPPIEHDPRIQELSEDLKQAGHHPFHLPVGRTPMQTTADAETICVKPALERCPNLTLLTESYVERLSTSASGREVTEVHVLHEEGPRTFQGDIVVVSCGALHSAALLLRSANAQHPNGLANRSGVVGRHYMCHNNSNLLVISNRPSPEGFQKTLGLSDFYFGAEEWNFPLGLIQMQGKDSAKAFRESERESIPEEIFAKATTHALDFWVTSEDLPNPRNRLLVKNNSLHLHYTPNNQKTHCKLLDLCKALLQRIGQGERGLSCTLQAKTAEVGHQNGTVRFGRDPTTSALDPFCKAHDLENLYVVDASFFPSCAAVNPALTIMANALRVGKHLLERI